ncbi:MAG: RagB/SusD family nutrient uptake outer membrane protein [Bacteroidales bacterium]|nr:RagB/SusD family nutrient uptake outer membrane protein [Bacteroidales bacterium]
MKHLYKYFIVALCLGMLPGCDLDIAPSDSLTGDQMAESPSGLQDIINGCYAVLKDDQEGQSSNCWYLRQYFQMSDFSSDDIVYGHETSDNLNMIFRYDDRDSGLENLTSFWINNYKVIYSANVALDIASRKEASAEVDYIKGEALFLKAFAMHNLVRLYAKPYSSANASTPGIIIRESNIDADNKARATVGETYEYILQCLTEAETLMQGAESSRSSSKGFASLGAVQAMLSRVYLYMGDNQKCIEYSTKVIESGNYALETPQSFPTYFRNAPQRDETIWCVIMISADNQQSASLASMIMSGEGCWAEEGYTRGLLEDMGTGTDLVSLDSRFSFLMEPIQKNGLTLYPCSKHSWQDGEITSISPVIFRLSEMYLNRAEAYAKTSQTDKALADVNEIRTHRIDAAGWNEFLYTAADLNGTTIVDLVLKEARVEFSFEAHRFYDLMRNGKDIVRNYWGFHILTYTPGQSTSTLPGLNTQGVFTPNNYDRLIFPIPKQEVGNNPLCEQNPGY